MKKLILLFSLSACACAQLVLENCEVAAKIEPGFVCGRRRLAADGSEYASFRGIPYAKQPLGRLRFQELQPLDNFTEIFNATEAGPICPQIDVLYGPILKPQSMGEDCIRINVHVPLKALPDLNNTGTVKPLLPIFMWIHGGGFSYGSGDADLHGPEYLVTKDVILVTFNYRLNVLGYLSITDSKYIPGNNGLRDALTALRWLQKNARSFGGDPAQVTLGGQSAGGVMAHILSISPASKGLFKRVMALSGYAIANFYSYSQNYAKLVSKIFLALMGTNILASQEDIHEKLIAAPIDKLLQAHKFILDLFGIVSFAPVMEIPRPGFTTVLAEDPDTLLNQGVGKNYPLLLGFTNNECQFFAPRLKEIGLELKLLLVPALILPMSLLYSTSALIIPVLTEKIRGQYFNGTLFTMEKFLPECTDSYFKYAALRLTQKRVASGAASTFLYEFGYHGENSTLKQVNMVDYPGAGHIEDITYFFRVNSALGPLVVNELNQTNADSRMKDWMTTFIAEYVKTGQPAAAQSGSTPMVSQWPATSSQLDFQRIEEPQAYNQQPITPYLTDMKSFFDGIFQLGRGI